MNLLKPQLPIKSQKEVMSVFNQCVDELIAEIRKINTELQDQEMIALRTRRIIEKWFRNGGRLK